jgi:glycosyltransferase involved in cell wall biosynthesis
MPISTASQAAGFNVVGHLTTAAGLGNTARSFAKVLEQRGYPVVGLNVDYGSDSRRTRVPPGIPLVDSPNKFPYRYNLICVATPLLPSLWMRRFPELRDTRFRNAGLLFWELPVLPKSWVPGIALFDALVLCSDFMRQTFESAVPGIPTVYAEHPLFIPENITSCSEIRTRFGLSKSTFVFGASFDLGGDIARKNPGALVRIFKQSFGDEDDVALLLKCNGSVDVAKGNPDIRRAIELTQSDRRIHIIAETLPYDTVLGIYAACDAYLSFHRAEGLGLGPMEAMALGKPVVATGYSGNISYMTEQNSILLPYRLKTTSGCAWQYKTSFCGKGAVWADVEDSHAVTALRRLRQSRERCLLIGDRARRDIAERQQTAHSAAFVDALIEFLEKGSRVQNRPQHAMQVQLFELFDPVLLRLNAKAAFEKIVQKRFRLSG